MIRGMGNIAFAAIVGLGGVFCGIASARDWWSVDPRLSPAMVMLAAILLGGFVRKMMQRRQK